MDIRVATTVDYKVYKKYYHFYLMKRKRHKYMAVKVILSLSIPLLIVLTGIIIQGFQSAVLPGLIFWASILLIVLYIFLFSPKILYSRNKKDENTSFNVYTFGYDKIHIARTGGKISGNFETDYSAFQYVYETDDFFYLFIRANQAYIVNKNGFEAGTPDDLRNLLKSKMPPKKYIICK